MTSKCPSPSTAQLKGPRSMKKLWRRLQDVNLYSRLLLRRLSNSVQSGYLSALLSMLDLTWTLAYAVLLTHAAHTHSGIVRVRTPSGTERIFKISLKELKPRSRK